jgi:HEAT repeat protein
MRPFAIITVVVLMIAFPIVARSQTSDEIKASVDDLVHKHYMDGIPYAQANALGPDALPYLFELLSNPDEKIFWTNIVVTIGFIEDPSAIDPLIAFLEGTPGDVDGATFRALMSVPYAVGNIAASGDGRAIDYLNANITDPLNLNLRWNYRGKPVEELIAEQSVMGLAVSGRPEARQRLQRLQADTTEKGGQETRRFRTHTVPQALGLMDRIDARGRAAVLNPQRGE